MVQRANERVAYFNGEIRPESQVAIPFRDRGFRYGDAVFDMTRTFGHRIFKLKPHIDRFYRSLRYVRIDPGLTPDQMIAATEEVLAANLHLLDEDEDYWVGQRVSRGEEPAGGDWSGAATPNVIIECTPLPLRSRARLFRDGIDVIVPSVRRVPPDSLSPNAKSHNYLNLVMADLEVRARNPDAWAVLLDVNGNLCEGMGSNIFVISDGALFTPKVQYVLPGVSRETAIELAEAEGLDVIEDDVSLFDGYNADEVFLTSTSLGLCGVRAINGAPIGSGSVPGPITKRITDAYVALVGQDFVGQYLKRLDG
ncbi:MAG: aminotransferase class IV [Alphaproteobacteria bacterium]|jgi:branched-chain amino acid aminotransferase|nr:aminotransferase class IV [Alphaproteobacteria bacterium]MDP6516417.1 aminotransferase class IV [Alphaproteobacteria bacterium]